MLPLQELEQIKCLKHRYFRALDTNDWKLMTSCLSEDCVARYDGGKYSFEGRKNILSFFSAYMDGPQVITLHQAHHPEIELSDDTYATGIWYLQDVVINLKENTTLRGAGFYHDEYKKIDDRWVITKTGYERTYEEIEPRANNITITSNMFTR